MTHLLLFILLAGASGAATHLVMRWYERRTAKREFDHDEVQREADECSCSAPRYDDWPYNRDCPQHGGW